MNSLSWFLYLADVIVSAQVLLGFLAFIFGAITAFWLFANVFAKADRDPTAEAITKSLWFAPWVFALTATLAVLAPSRDTIYLIAGSEAGETVVTSEAGQEILLDIQEVIQHQLDQLKGPTEKSSDTP